MAKATVPVMSEQQEAPPESVGPSHYFDGAPTVPSAPASVPLRLPDLTVDLGTDRGVFAQGAVDVGTRFLLLDGPAATPGDRHLVDLGCGYGPIAVTLAHRNPEATVWAVDVNERARDLTAANAEALGLGNIRVIAPQDWPGDIAVDRIWSNPPIRVGKTVLHDLLTTWLDRLGPAGTAHLVVQKHLGSDSLQRWMIERGWATTRRGSRKAFRLLDVDARTNPEHRS